MDAVTPEMKAEYDRRYRTRLNFYHALESAMARQAVKDAEAEDAKKGLDNGSAVR